MTDSLPLSVYAVRFLFLGGINQISGPPQWKFVTSAANTGVDNWVNVTSFLGLMELSLSEHSGDWQRDFFFHPDSVWDWWKLGVVSSVERSSSQLKKGFRDRFAHLPSTALRYIKLMQPKRTDAAQSELLFSMWTLVSSTILRCLTRTEK